MWGICELAEELVLEILLRLPADSVLQSKLVCKRWYDLIKNPSFAAKHLHYSTTMPSSSTALLVAGPGPSVIKYAIFNYSADGTGGMINCVANEESNRFRYPLFLCCHCNGIFMLTYGFRFIILLNPIIKELKLLPNPRSQKCRSYKAIGFGYDSKAYEYKVVTVSEIGKANIYTINSDCWREIEFVMPKGIVSITREQVYCKGVYYWLMLSYQCKKTILWFDMSDEKFGTIELPDGIGSIALCTKLMLHNDTVVLLCHPILARRSQAAVIAIGMWVLNDCCWTKLETIGPIRLSRIIAFWKSGELLYENKSPDLLYSYNLGSKKCRNASFGISFGSCLAFPYVGSLVSLKIGNELDRLSTFEAFFKFLENQH